MASAEQRRKRISLDPKSGGFRLEGPQFFAVLDSNIWVHDTRILQAPVGRSLRRSVVNAFGHFAMSEVIEFEIYDVTKRFISELATRADAAVEQIDKIMGRESSLGLPTDSEVEAVIGKRLDELKSVMHVVKMDLDQAKSALFRVLKKEPPNGVKDQQFKDSIIWEHCLFLANQAPAYFVTHDRHFFRNGDPKLGLAESLATDAQRTKFELLVFSDVSALITHIDAASLVRIDTVSVITEVGKDLEFDFMDYARSSKMALAALDPHDPVNEVLVFHTDDPQSKSLTFDVRRKILSIDGRPEAGLYLSATGSGDRSSKRPRRHVTELKQMEVRDDQGHRLRAYPVRELLGNYVLDPRQWD